MSCEKITNFFDETMKPSFYDGTLTDYGLTIAGKPDECGSVRKIIKIPDLHLTVNARTRTVYDFRHL